MALVWVLAHNSPKVKITSIKGVNQPNTGAIDFMMGMGARIIWNTNK